MPALYWCVIGQPECFPELWVNHSSFIHYFNRSGFKIDVLAISKARSQPERPPNPPQITCTHRPPTRNHPVHLFHKWLILSLLLPACRLLLATQCRVYPSLPGSPQSWTARPHLHPQLNLHAALHKTTTTKPRTLITAKTCCLTGGSVSGI